MSFPPYNEHEIWKLTNLIKNGQVQYQIGDEVNLFKRKTNGHPRGIKDDKKYFILKIENENLEVTDNIKTKTKIIKVHKTYMIPKSYLRQIKINSILSETKSSTGI